MIVYYNIFIKILQKLGNHGRMKDRLDRDRQVKQGSQVTRIEEVGLRFKV